MEFIFAMESEQAPPPPLLLLACFLLRTGPDCASWSQSDRTRPISRCEVLGCRLQMCTNTLDPLRGHSFH